MKTKLTFILTALVSAMITLWVGWRRTAAVSLIAASTTIALQAQEGVPAVIDDADGYTNIRAAATKQSKTLGRVVEDEEFTVYPSDAQWWRIQTKDGLSGFIHQSCVRVLASNSAAPSANDAAPITISKDPATVRAWTDYVAIHESERRNKEADGAVIIRECAKIDLEGVDLIVAGHIRSEIALLTYMEALAGRVRGEASRTKPIVILRDGLRPYARDLGRKLMPDAPDLGEVLGDVLTIYGFSDVTTIKGMPDETTLYQKIVDHDRLLVGEALINSALAMPQPEGLVRLLGRVRDRASSARLQTGKWILRDADGSVADLKMRIDPKAAWNAGGWVTMDWRQRGRSDLSFQYEFAADGTYHLLDTGMGAMLMGKLAPRQIMRATWIRPTILKITTQKGESAGTWEQISSR